MMGNQVPMQVNVTVTVSGSVASPKANYVGSSIPAALSPQLIDALGNIKLGELPNPNSEYSNDVVISFTLNGGLEDATAIKFASNPVELDPAASHSHNQWVGSFVGNNQMIITAANSNKEAVCTYCLQIVTTGAQVTSVSLDPTITNR
jgi:hypothetical protein